MNTKIDMLAASNAFFSHALPKGGQAKIPVKMYYKKRPPNEICKVGTGTIENDSTSEEERT